MSIPQSARPTLLQLVEEHVTTLIRDAVTVQRHCKRARWNPPLHPTPGVDPSAMTPGSGNYFKTRLHAADINLALQLQGSEKLYGTVYPMHGAPSGVDPQSKVLLSDVLREEIPLPPEEVSMRQHWLVVAGKPMEMSGPNYDVALGSNVISGISRPERPPVGALDPTYESSEVILRVHQLQSGLLSEELKLYFLRVVATIERGSATQYDRNQQDLVLHQLEFDDGLQELVPFLVRYAQHSIYEQLSLNTEHSVTIVRLIRALLSNPTLHLELHLHELLPALMTCIVAQSLGESVATPSKCSHWKLRQEAATTLAVGCSLFGTEYATLKSRILRALCQALDVGSLPSRYGGIVAISLFGSRAIDAFLLPLLADCWEVWEEELYKSSLSKHMEEDISMCQQALLTGMSFFLRSTTLEEKAERLMDLKIDDILGGDRMMILSGEENEFNMCFV